MKEPFISVLISEEKLNERIAQLGEQISKDYEGKEVDLSIYLNDIPSYQSGIYTVEAYTSQAFLGKTELLLR